MPLQNTVELSLERITKAIEYAENNGLTYGYTSIIYKTEEDIERVIGVPTLAVIPLMKGQDNKKSELKEQTEAIKNAKRKKE